MLTFNDQEEALLADQQDMLLLKEIETKVKTTDKDME